MIRSPPPLPSIFLIDGYLTKSRGGKKGPTRPMILCFFAAARVTTGRANLNVQSIFPRTPFEWFPDCYRTGGRQLTLPDRVACVRFCRQDPAPNNENQMHVDSF